MTRLLAGAGLLAGLVALAAVASPAEAQETTVRPERETRDRLAYDNGYRVGYQHGTRDAVSGARFDYEHDVLYQQGVAGYATSHGDPDRYRRRFRDGYGDGYRTGYAMAAGRARGAGEHRAAAPIGSSAGNPAFSYDVGFVDGYDRGVEDAREANPYDAVRHKRYREAERGSQGRGGVLERYRQEYRAGFRAGYDQGYRDTYLYATRVARRRRDLPARPF